MSELIPARRDPDRCPSHPGELIEDLSARPAPHQVRTGRPPRPVAPARPRHPSGPQGGLAHGSSEAGQVLRGRSRRMAANASGLTMLGTLPVRWT